MQCRHQLPPHLLNHHPKQVLARVLLHQLESLSLSQGERVGGGVRVHSEAAESQALVEQPKNVQHDKLKAFVAHNLLHSLYHIAPKLRPAQNIHMVASSEVALSAVPCNIQAASVSRGLIVRNRLQLIHSTLLATHILTSQFTANSFTFLSPSLSLSIHTLIRDIFGSIR
ncbi:hypothetical protein BLNAU_8571 [Blattamonas nauphoetae]|uniref:Uncharacterized protein n=1 Tax=Blattamonas nauphoetae TaxID=2049346 RepID=A0ABQ9XYE5_9EUKA|nr:hypothetical protein BLNAU_17250 [Blattamonas nauphoetae]KAK2956517.1 hypothetical protein BLNAU_8571 [Blattamonas nauphoetae]